MRKNEKPEKPMPVRCICGAPPAVVRYQRRELLSCPNPVRCSGNFCTGWHSDEETAVIRWNTLIAQAQAQRGGRK